MAFEVLTGWPPSVSDGLGELMALHVFEAPPDLAAPMPGIRPEQALLVRSMLVKKPAERPTMAVVVSMQERLGARKGRIPSLTGLGSGPTSTREDSGSLALREGSGPIDPPPGPQPLVVQPGTETSAARVCIAGDGAQSGQAAEYAEASDSLDATLRRLELGRARLFVVPGNHDIHRAPSLTAAEARQTCATDCTAPSRLPSHSGAQAGPLSGALRMRSARRSRPDSRTAGAGCWASGVRSEASVRWLEYAPHALHPARRRNSQLALRMQTLTYPF